MSDNPTFLRYLLPPDDSFWTWGDEGEVVQWKAGGTIAFREQVLQVLSPFADRNLPPFELVLLVLGACRDTWSDERARLADAASPFRHSARPALQMWWRDTLASLDHIHRLPRAIRTSPVFVPVIVEIALDRHPAAAAGAQTILATLAESHWMRDLELPSPLVIPMAARANQFAGLARGLVDLTDERIRSRASTGLDQLPGPIEDTLDLDQAPPVTTERTVRQLLEELREDDELRGLVRLVRLLSAVLTLPRNPSEPDELPQGGVSDIANRGTIDRLLLSELANDDETLMTRIALNEALYIRRETPQSQPIHERVVLIDAGIRMWGLPRVCAAAVALCLASQTSGGPAARLFRSHGDELKPVDFTTRDGLIEHLAALDHRAHPADVLDAWLRQGTGEGADRVLITGDDVWVDREFRRQFAQRDLTPCFVITVDRTGHVRLLRRTELGEKLLRELWLDLDEVTGAQEQKRVSLVDTSIDRRLPSILRLTRLPLRLPYSDYSSAALSHLPGAGEEPADVLQVTRDGRLLLWDSNRAGGIQLTDRLPPGRLFWSGQLWNDGRVSLVIGRQQLGSFHHVLVDVQQQDVTICSLQLLTGESGHEHVFGVCSHLGALMIILRNSIIAVDLVTETALDAFHLVGVSNDWKRDRIFLHRGEWKMLSYSGSGGLCLELVLDSLGELNTVDGVLGIVGPPDRLQAVMSYGALYDICERVHWQPGERRIPWTGGQLAGVSPDGLRFLVTVGIRSRNTFAVESGSQHYVVTLFPPQSPGAALAGTVNAVTYSTDPLRLLLTDGIPIRELPIFKKIAKLGYGRQLVIATAKGRRMMLELRQGNPRGIKLRDLKETDGPIRVTQSFEPCPAPDGVGYTLKQVTWTDGSRAVLDSRGMLHLQSSDLKIPELSLILDESHVSGWCSTGQTWGLDYYLNVPGDRSGKIDATQVMEFIEQFLRRLP